MKKLRHREIIYPQSCMLGGSGRPLHPIVSQTFLIRHLRYMNISFHVMANCGKPIFLVLWDKGKLLLFVNVILLGYSYMQSFTPPNKSLLRIYMKITGSKK